MTATHLVNINMKRGKQDPEPSCSKQIDPDVEEDIEDDNDNEDVSEEEEVDVTQMKLKPEGE